MSRLVPGSGPWHSKRTAQTQRLWPELTGEAEINAAVLESGEIWLLLCTKHREVIIELRLNPTHYELLLQEIERLREKRTNTLMNGENNE